jgi:FkbM family methyltransferase
VRTPIIHGFFKKCSGIGVITNPILGMIIFMRKIQRLKTRTHFILERVFGSSPTEFAYHKYKQIEFMVGKQLVQKEKNLINAVSVHIEAGSTAIDIGAFIGAWTRVLSKKVGSSGKVIAFEPIPGNYDLLKNLCNKYQNIDIYNLALSDKNSFVKMVIPNDVRVSPIAAITCTADQLDNKRLLKFLTKDCNSRCLDDIIRDISIPKISFIKCDVEGHELQVMKGARRTILDHKPFLAMEILKEKWKDHNPLFSDIAQFMVGLGYDMGQFIDDKIVYSDMFSSGSEDFVFRPHH